MAPRITIRELSTAADYAACVALQKETWGQSFTECVPATMLKIAQQLGGVAAGAFEDDLLVGFVFGLTGLRDRRIIHWSDMLAVRGPYRNRGIGEQLKRYQRSTMLARGVDRVLWTFDPLDAKNAHINFNRLGVYAREYVVDMYGDTSSPLHEGIGTDRLIVTWELASPRVDARLAGQTLAAVNAAAIRIEIPVDIHALKRADLQHAKLWRLRTREAFLKYLPDYVVVGFSRSDAGGCYELTSAASFAT